MTAGEVIELELLRLGQRGDDGGSIVQRAARRIADAQTIIEALRRKPAAWRVKDFGDGWIYFPDESSAAACRAETGALLQPLFTLEP